MAPEPNQEEITRRLRLGIDMDGVVADFHRGWVERYRDEFGGDVSPEAVDGWDSLVGLTHFDDDRSFWRWAERCDPGLFLHLPEVDGAVPALRSLAERHRVVIITAKVAWAIPDTLGWLAERRIPAGEVHFTFDKAEVACDVYLDDSEHHLVDYLEQRPDAVACRMVRPWNEPVPGAVDVHDWGEFADVVASIEGSGG